MVDDITPMFPNNLVFRRLGHKDYESVWSEMKAFTKGRTLTSPDMILSVEHPPVYTQGQGGRPEHILAAGDIPIIQTDRGGQVTYHGPGQLVLYFMIDLIRKHIKIREFVSYLERSVVAMLADYSITAMAREEAPGVYVNGAKICSIGLKVMRGRTYHGIALNVDMDLRPFLRINPCGYKNLKMTQMRELVLPETKLEFVAIERKIIDHFLKALKYDLLIIEE